jgi:hypothetical protein
MRQEQQARRNKREMEERHRQWSEQNAQPVVPEETRVEILPASHKGLSHQPMIEIS